MYGLPKSQSCPYCYHEVEDCYAEWDEGDHIVKCSYCKKEYSVEPVYQFEGFRISKICEGCGENQEDCYCDEE